MQLYHYVLVFELFVGMYFLFQDPIHFHVARWCARWKWKPGTMWMITTNQGDKGPVLINLITERGTVEVTYLCTNSRVDHHYRFMRYYAKRVPKKDEGLVLLAYT